MSATILKWLGGNDTGASSKVLALTALGAMPADAKHSYPRDGADFGRCYRLLEQAPEAKHALALLAASGGPYWAALVARWEDIGTSYLAEMALPRGERGKTYDLMRTLLDPIEAADSSVIRLGEGVSVRFGR